jgi:hypothetical protein
MSNPRRKNAVLAEKIILDVSLVAAVSANTTLALGVMDGMYYLDKFEIITPSTFAGTASNYWILTLQDVTASVTLATWSTLTGAQGTLTALTSAIAVNGGVVSGVSGDQLNVVLTVNGAPTAMPAQTRFVAHLHQQ